MKCVVRKPQCLEFEWFLQSKTVSKLCSSTGGSQISGNGQSARIQAHSKSWRKPLRSLPRIREFEGKPIPTILMPSAHFTANFSHMLWHALCPVFQHQELKLDETLFLDRIPHGNHPGFHGCTLLHASGLRHQRFAALFSISTEFSDP
jgi:hypothetical protein